MVKKHAYTSHKLSRIWSTFTVPISLFHKYVCNFFIIYYYNFIDSQFFSFLFIYRELLWALVWGRSFHEPIFAYIHIPHFSFYLCIPIFHSFSTWSRDSTVFLNACINPYQARSFSTCIYPYSTVFLYSKVLSQLDLSLLVSWPVWVLRTIRICEQYGFRELL